MADATARGSVHGIVQGVWFRAFTREQALRHGLSGYARNQADGSATFDPPEGLVMRAV